MKQKIMSPKISVGWKGTVEMTTHTKFYLDKQNAKWKGVCAGIADYTGVEVLWVRLAAVMLTLMGGFPWTLIAYWGVAWFGSKKPVHLWGDPIKDRHTGSEWVERRSESPVHVQANANIWKSHAARRLLTTPGAPSALLLPGDDERANRLLVEHLTAERPIQVSREGTAGIKWEAIVGRDNDWWDTLYGNCVAASMLGCTLSGEVSGGTKPKRQFSMPGGNRG